MVDPSLLRQAADRGVTICFADLDGADGLWVPEERTIMVNRGLSDAAVAEVIEHELTHVAIDDQHADLDAGRDVVVGRPPPRRTGAWSVVLAAAASVAVVAGVVVGLTKAGTGGRGEQVVLPKPTGRLTASESAEGGVPVPGTTVVVTRDSQGRIITRTVVLTPSASPRTAAATTAGSLTPTPTPRPTAARTSKAPAVGAVTVSPTPPPTPTPTAVLPSPTPTATTDPAVPTPVPTGTGAGEAGGGGGGAGDSAGDAAGTTTLGDAPSEDSAGTATAITTAGPTITAAG